VGTEHGAIARLRATPITAGTSVDQPRANPTADSWPISLVPSQGEMDRLRGLSPAHSSGVHERLDRVELALADSALGTTSSTRRGSPVHHRDAVSTPRRWAKLSSLAPGARGRGARGHAMEHEPVAWGSTWRPRTSASCSRAARVTPTSSERFAWFPSLSTRAALRHVHQEAIDARRTRPRSHEFGQRPTIPAPRALGGSTAGSTSSVRPTRRCISGLRSSPSAGADARDIDRGGR